MLSNLRIGKKLLIGFGLLTLLLVAVGLTGVYYLWQANHYSDEMGRQKDIETDAQIVNGYVYQARFYAMRGLYAKDVQEDEKKTVENSYRDFLDDEIEKVRVDLAAAIDRILSRLDIKNNEEDASDAKLCEAIKNEHFPAYAKLTTDWADEQDKVLKSAKERVAIANKVQEAVKQVIATTDANIDNEQRVIQVDGEDKEFTAKRLAIRQKEMGEVLELIELCRRLTREQVAITESARLHKANQDVNEAFAKTKKKLEDLVKSYKTKSNAEETQNALDHLKEWETEVLQYEKYVERQHGLFDQFGDAARHIVDNLTTVLENANKNAISAEKSMNSMIQTASTIIFTVISLAVVLAIAAGIIVATNITKGIASAVSAMNLVAHEGDLSFDIPQVDLDRKDEVGDLAMSVDAILKQFRNVESLATKLAEGDWREQVKVRGEKDAMNINLASMLDQVNSALGEINENVKQVSTGAGEVSSASQTLSSGAQESAASLEEITASMSEISSQTKQNASSATEARDLAQKATQAATEGQEAMQEMTSAMERITKNSDEIQRVVKVIDDIAFQTNLLALNAAVEAARAGVHGKGFAVVAEEVRNLAARSAKAAKETTDLISKSGQEISNGDKVASQTSEVLDSIVEQIKKTTDLVAGIAVASNEQAQGVAQVTVGLQQIDQVTQQNTAAAEESASAANEMSGMASNLQSMVAKFKLRS